MKLIFAIPLLALLLSPKADEKNLCGTYVSEREVELDREWMGTEKRTLTLNADKSFYYFIHYANSDFPGEYAGKWQLNDKELILDDTCNRIPGERIRIRMKLVNGALCAKERRTRYNYYANRNRAYTLLRKPE